MKYYITWNKGAELYWNGESWQQGKEGAFIGYDEECQQQIEAHDLRYTELQPAFFNGTGVLLNQIFPS